MSDYSFYSDRPAVDYFLGSYVSPAGLQLSSEHTGANNDIFIGVDGIADGNIRFISKVHGEAAPTQGELEAAPSISTPGAFQGFTVSNSASGLYTIYVLYEPADSNLDTETQSVDVYFPRAGYKIVKLETVSDSGDIIPAEPALTGAYVYANEVYAEYGNTSGLVSDSLAIFSNCLFEWEESTQGVAGSFDLRYIEINSATIGNEATITTPITGNNGVVAPVMPADASVNINEGQVAAGAFAVTSGENVSYTLGGVDAGLFTVNSAAEVFFLSPPDFEAAADQNADNEYLIAVIATNSGGSDSQNISINVQDVLDTSAPVMPADAAVSVNEGQASAGAFSAVSGDTPITYSLGGVDAGLFSINASTGAVSFTLAPDFENPSDSGADNNYQITVTAANSVGSDSQNISITVLDGQESYPPVMPASLTANVIERESLVGIFPATSGAAPITYSIGGGLDAALFSINENTASLAFTDVTDTEYPQDSDANNDYEVIIRASNSAGESLTNLTVNVLPDSVSGVQVFVDLPPIGLDALYPNASASMSDPDFSIIFAGLEPMAISAIVSGAGANIKGADKTPPIQAVFSLEALGLNAAHADAAAKFNNAKTEFPAINLNYVQVSIY